MKEKFELKGTKKSAEQILKEVCMDMEKSMKKTDKGRVL
jgi:hypothetical protein